LALLVTNAAEEKSATSYPLRIPLHSPQKLPYSLDSACLPRIVNASLIHLLFPIRLQLQACIRSLAIPLRRPGAAITSRPSRFHPSSSWPAAIPQVPHHIHHPKSNLPCNPCNKGVPSSDYG
jgi:hypothetical protein